MVSPSQEKYKNQAPSSTKQIHISLFRFTPSCSLSHRKKIGPQFLKEQNHAYRSFNEYLCTCNKSPMQRGFFKNSAGDLLPTQGFWVSCIVFLILQLYFNVSHKRYDKKATYFTDWEMIDYYQKTCDQKSIKCTKAKNYATVYVRYTTLKNSFSWFTLY